MKTFQHRHTTTPKAMEEELEQLVAIHGMQGTEEAAMTTKIELTVDEIIEEYVGSFGFSQLLQVFMVSLAWMFDSQNTLVTIFSDAQPSWRCIGSSSCSSLSMCELKPGTWEWEGGKASTTIAEWGLICGHKFRAGIPASMFFLGSILVVGYIQARHPHVIMGAWFISTGSAVHGRLADTYLGRKKTVLLSCILTSITAFLTSFSPNVWVYALLRFSNGFARSGIGICCLVLSTEVLGRKWQGQVGQYGFFFFTAGFLSLPIIAYPTRTSWRNIYMIISFLPLLYSLSILPFVSESPRWLAVRGRTKEAMEVLNKLARLNGKNLPNNVTISKTYAVKANEPNSTESLWSVRWATKRMVTLMIAGFGIGLVYHGVQLNAENLNFNLYFTVALNALMEIPAVFFGSVLLGFMERRIIFSLSACITGLSCILCILFSGKNSDRNGKNDSKGSRSQLTAEAFGFMVASTAFDVLYIYCVEMFPTNLRNFAVSMLRRALMSGAAIAPFLVVLGRLSPSISFLIFGSFAIFSGVLTFWLPETRNVPLCETLEQQEKEERLSSISDPGIELGK